MAHISENQPHPGRLSIIWRDGADEEVYENARVGRVFNQRRPSNYPRAVVEANCEQDVVDAVRLAVKLGCRVSIRSGGHSWAAWSVRQDAILIDLGKYKSINLDEKRAIVVVTPSVTGKLLMEHLGDKGYMFCGGHCPDVGLGGFLLQGGMGWNYKNWGWACEQITALDVVTAQGELIHCTTHQNQEYLWAARGAGPGFPGIVTKFHLAVRPKANHMCCSTFIYPMSLYRTAMTWAISAAEIADHDTEVVAVAAQPPGFDTHAIVVNFVAFKNSVEEGKAALESPNTSRPEGFLLELPNQPTSMAIQYKQQASANPDGHRYCCDNAYIDNNADLLSLMEASFTTLPDPKSFTLWFPMYPNSRSSNASRDDMCVGLQSDHYLAIYTVWEDERDDAKCIQWVRKTMRDMEKYSIGSYLGDSDFQVRETKYWTDENAAKLMELRRKLDPLGTICGYLDRGDASGTKGLRNVLGWQQ